MAVDIAIAKLVDYAVARGLIEECEYTWAVNAVLDVLRLDSFTAPERNWEPEGLELAPILEELLDDAYARGILVENTVTRRDLLDAELMGRLTPRPHEVRESFRGLRDHDPKRATDWYYAFSQDTNYIRRDRVARDMKWVAETRYGPLDITINLSKPEKDPKAIAAAKSAPQNAYPKCQLCVENEGYAGRLDHPARGNHRVIPITIDHSPWFLQYSPYVYYPEHCICFNARHTPMAVNKACFDKLLDFIGQFPHYFVGSNADLPIVGGSILSHDHFQGGHYTFAMERAPIERTVTFLGYPDITAGIVKWPMSVIRLRSKDPARLSLLAEHILNTWRGYTDEAAFIYAQTDGESHNTITPIARRRDGDFELDLVLRNNITTKEFPLGVYHPHPELHHIKKENIGLIEVMGLAVLPARLLPELQSLADALVSGCDPAADPQLEKHAAWAGELKSRYTFRDPSQAMDILKDEVGQIFAQVLENAGVYKCTPDGREAFARFLESAGGR